MRKSLLRRSRRGLQYVGVTPARLDSDDIDNVCPWWSCLCSLLTVSSDAGIHIVRHIFIFIELSTLFNPNTTVNQYTAVRFYLVNKYVDICLCVQDRNEHNNTPQYARTRFMMKRIDNLKSEYQYSHHKLCSHKKTLRTGTGKSSRLENRVDL